MDIFNKSANVLGNDIRIELENEPEFYTPGSNVEGRVVVRNRMWPQMLVEVVILCAEHAVILEPQQEPIIKQRRVLVAGESIDGEDVDGFGVFNFELRIPDDPHIQTHLPSFEIEHEHDDDDLTNYIRWLVEAKVTHKRKFVEVNREVVFVPTRPLPESNQQKIYKQTGNLKVYQPASSPFAKMKKIDSVIVAVLQFPESGLKHYPSTIPLKLMLLLNHPHLIYISSLSVELLSTAIANINGRTRKHTVVEMLCEPFKIDVKPESDMVDLSDHLSDIAIRDQCASFRGKWISMQHQLRIVLEIGSQHNKKVTYKFEITAPVHVLPPRTVSDIVDAPPVYSQLAECVEDVNDNDWTTYTTIQMLADKVIQEN